MDDMGGETRGKWPEYSGERRKVAGMFFPSPLLSHHPNVGLESYHISLKYHIKII